MAPYLQENVLVSAPFGAKPNTGNKPKLGYEPGGSYIERLEDYDHPLLPSFPNVKWPALQEVPYHDRGLDGDNDFAHLLQQATSIQDYTPKIGTEVTGINLAKLTNLQKNDLARLIATRGVVFFRNQEDLDIEAQRELGSYFGVLHKHATTSVPREPGLEDVHVVYTEGEKYNRAMFTPSFLWHSDVRDGQSLRSLAFANNRTGHLRDATSILHFPETPERPTIRRRRRHIVV